VLSVGELVRIKDLPRLKRAAKWKELTGKSEKALYRRLTGK